jgi:hypothetical protein
LELELRSLNHALEMELYLQNKLIPEVNTSLFEVSSLIFEVHNSIFAQHSIATLDEAEQSRLSLTAPTYASNWGALLYEDEPHYRQGLNGFCLGIRFEVGTCPALDAHFLH